MHKSLTIGLSGLTCLTIVACQSQEKTESIPATPLQQPPIVADAPEAPVAIEALLIGDDAPAISVDHWVKGGPIENFNDGQVYVMEFWATWCGPCLYSMPHLSELQDEYGESVKIIGVSSEKELQTVTDFLAETSKIDGAVNDDRMRYTVAVDPDRSTSDAYMKAAGQNGIPTAFIIDGNGKVAWIGHPMSMDEPLSEVVNGTWDIAAATSAFQKEQAEEHQGAAAEREQMEEHQPRPDSMESNEQLTIFKTKP